MRYARRRSGPIDRPRQHPSRDPAERAGLCRMPGQPRLVVPSAALRPVRPCRLLRLVAVAACEPACVRGRPPDRPDLRARRGLVLGLPARTAPRRAGARAAAAPPTRATGAGASGPGATRLAATAPLAGSAVPLRRRTFTTCGGPCARWRALLLPGRRSPPWPKKSSNA